MNENQENILNDECTTEVNCEERNKRSYNLRECSIKCENIDIPSDSEVSRKKRKSIVSVSNDDKKKREEERLKKENEKKQRELEKEQERLKKEEERKRKEEERRKKLEEKRLKDLEREEERKRREEEKRLKEIEKEEDRKRREEEKRLKEIEKEEDRKRREEERRLKDLEKEEERKKREEERIRKENERKKEELEKERKIEKQRAIFAGFFKKDSLGTSAADLSMTEDAADNKIEVEIEQIGIFRPLEIKKEMKISELDRGVVKAINFQKLPDCTLSKIDILRDLSERCYISVGDTWPEEQSDLQITSSYIRNNLYTKFLMFHENIRPPYCGTWNKTSNKITGLNPLEEDELFFDYECDSDADWECESGEDIAASEDEEEEDVNQDQDDLDFLVPHGYLSDGEDRSDVDPDEVDEEGNRIKDERRQVKGDETGIPETVEEKERMIEDKHKQFEAEVMKKVYRINPNCVGPYFENKPETAHFKQLLVPFTMICRSPDGYPITCNLQTDCYNTGEPLVKMKSVPPEAIPFLIRLVHCNMLSQIKLCYEFRMFWEKHLTGKVPHVTIEDDLQGKDWDEFSIGKKRLITKIKEIANKIDKKWMVKANVLKEYQICCADDKLENPCMEKWEYVSGVDKLESIAKIQKKIKKQDNSLMPLTE